MHSQEVSSSSLVWLIVARMTGGGVVYGVMRPLHNSGLSGMLCSMECADSYDMWIRSP